MQSVASESSFDVVSKVDRQEVDNALRQASKEIAQRYDFKGVGASIEWQSDVVVMAANSEQRVLGVLDVFETKLVQRKVSLKAMETSAPKLSGKVYRITSTPRNGLDAEHLKAIAKIIRDEAPKGTKVQPIGDELRVSSRSRDDLQAVMAVLRAKDLDIALQFVNYR